MLYESSSVNSILIVSAGETFEIINNITIENNVGKMRML
jgi:hypothetical protein